MNPNLYGDPDTYLGTNWATGPGDNGGVHTNSGVQNFWYYLLCQGGSGTNDNGNAYTVSGIGVSSAEKIVYRSLTTYLTPTSQYADARVGAIQAAQDLFGACAPEVIAVTNAWYAVGVGAQYSATVTASFTASATSSCSLPFTVNFTNTSINATNATWDFGDATTSTAYNPSHTYTAAGTYNVQLIVTSACGTDSVLQTAYITINPPASPATTGAFICTSPASVILSASGTGTLQWYTTPTGGVSVNTGTTYTTPSLASPTTYYVENQMPGTTGNVGPVNNSFGTGGNHNSATNQYLIFNVLQPCTLQTVWVNSSTAGNRTINLWDNAGNVLQTLTINIPNGQNTITLNLPLNPGTGYRLGGNSMNLYRNNSGPSYPYTLSGTVTITSSSAGSNYYYYFYNWVVTTAPCISARTPVLADIGGPNVAYSNASYDTICSVMPAFALTGGSPAGGTYSGTGVSAGNFDPAVSGPGTFVITYSYTDGNGCTNSTSQNIFVDVCSGIAAANASNDFTVSPNPSTGSFFVTFSPGLDGRYEITDALGKIIRSQKILVHSGAYSEKIDLENEANGIYFLKVSSANYTAVKKIVKD